MTTAHTDLDPFRSLLLTAKVRVPAFVLSLAKAPELGIRCIQDFALVSVAFRTARSFRIKAFLEASVVFGAASSQTHTL